jgi:hypothetical protein
VPLVGQEIVLARFEPPQELERLLVDERAPRTGPAVLLFADAIDIGQRLADPAEPQRHGWTEVAIGYHTEARGRPATAYHYPWLLLSAPRGDDAGPIADVQMTQFHPACPGYDGPAAGRVHRSMATTYHGVPIAELEVALEAEASPDELPDGLFLWVNRIAWPDYAAPGAELDVGLFLVPPHELELDLVWRGRGHACFGAGLGWEGELEGEAWYCGAKFELGGAEPL